MPAQSPSRAATAYYSQNDTSPPLRRQLQDGDSEPIPLTNASSVTLTLAHQREDHYYSPRTPTVERASCFIEDPRTDGWVFWVPADGDLHLPGSYHLIFEINWSNGTRQTVPAHTYETLVITTKPGGFET